MDEPEFLDIVNTIDSATETAGNGLAADYIPVFKYIPTPAKSKTIQMANAIVNYIERQLAEHRQLYSAGIFIGKNDHYLRENGKDQEYILL